MRRFAKSAQLCFAGSEQLRFAESAQLRFAGSGQLRCAGIEQSIFAERSPMAGPRGMTSLPVAKSIYVDTSESEVSTFEVMIENGGTVIKREGGQIFSMKKCHIT